jgi:hypothetical protein
LQKLKGDYCLDAKGYLYSAELLDLLVTTVSKEKWDEILITEIGSLGRLFTHMSSIAIQHEGIHQGQKYVALKQAGIAVPEQWRSNWHLC